MWQGKIVYLDPNITSKELLKNMQELPLIKCLSWKEKNLTRFNFIVCQNIKQIISCMPDEIESEYEQYDRCFRFVNSSEVPEKMESVLERAPAFHLDNHLEIKCLSEFKVSCFMKLKFCVVSECRMMKVMIKEEGRNDSDFPNLEYLGLHYLWELEKIWEDGVPVGSYQALKYLKVSTCCKLQYIASHAVLKCFNNLETLIVEDCESLESIVKETQGGKKSDKRLLPSLKRLVVLSHLPHLHALGRGLVPSEKVITVQFCPKLKLNLTRPTKMGWKIFTYGYGGSS